MKKIVFLSLILCAMFVVISAYAEEPQGIKVGQATLYPSLKVEERYDSNIYLDSSNRKHDFINVATPAFRLKVPFGDGDRHLAELIYKADIESYADYDRENHVNQDINGVINFKFPKGYLTLKDLFRLTSDRADTEFTSLVKRTENKGDVIIGVEMNKLTYELGYSNFFRNYTDDIDLNTLEYTEQIGTLTAYYRIFPKTQALLEYNHGEIEYENDSDRDGDYNQVRVGLKGDLTGKTSGIVKVGFQGRDYNAASDNKDFETFVMESGLLTKFSERTELEFRYSRSAYESTYADNNYYDGNRLQTKLTQKLWSNMSWVTLMQYERNKYPKADAITGENRKDNIYTFNTGLQYDVKDWLKAKLYYEYKEDASNVDSSDYGRHLTSLSFTLLM